MGFEPVTCELPTNLSKHEKFNKIKIKIVKRSPSFCSRYEKL